ncbi:mechanosensitive ion channel family protein [Luteimonas sp. WGS1318]|uniref:mechanosensitive ion channel family protein n=1 Tax=Luteimonas sp. WGS1318 TaxID=3366815 RepID=UPI00372D1393
MSALPRSESRCRRPALYIAAALLLALFALGVPQASAAAPAPVVQTPAAAETAPPVEVDVDVRGRFDAVYDEIRERTVRMIAHLPLLLAAIVIVLLAARLGRLVSQRLHWLRLRTRNPYLDGLMRRVVHGVILVAGVLVALDLLNATALVGALLGSAGVFGLALGFAFKDIAENYIAGILLSLRRPFSPGDTVRIDSYEGKVAALSARDMVLVTMDGNELRLPNALVFKAVLLNFSSNPRRRFEFTFNVDASQSIRKAQDIALAEIAGIEGVLADPAPSWSVVEFGSAGTVLRFFGWIDQRQSDLGKTRSEAIRLVKGAFWRAGIEGPRTTNHVVLSRAVDDGAPPRGADLEPATSIGVDTSVNRDIDRQVADVQNSDQNLLNPKESTP